MSENQQVAFEGWLSVATDGLATPVRDRIRLETEAHFVGSVARHLTEGLTEAGAIENAMIEMGGAAEAGRQFRRRHLTEKEAQYIETTLQAFSVHTSLVWTVLHCGAVILMAVICLVMSESRRTHVECVAGVAMAIVASYGIVRFLMARGDRSSRTVRILMAIELLSDLTPLAYSLALGLCVSKGVAVSIASVTLLGCLRNLQTSLPVYFKVMRVANVKCEMPLRG